MEPSQPFTLGLLVRNTGAGSARNVTVRSGQPRIVENEKGLLIDFQVVASEVFAPDATRLLTPSLTADLGDLEPGGVRVSRWLLKSTLQGLFLDYSATVEHLDPLGQPAFEAVLPGSVRIHELTHLVRDPRAGADALPDFLVNEDPASDPEDLPDSVHLSNGSIEPVHALAQATPDAVPTLQRREILLNLGSTASGWTYLRIPDPQGPTGQRAFRLVAVLRPDGSTLPAFNFWQTDRTFIGLGRRPILGNHLHLLDHGAPAHYRLVYEPVTPRDTVAPVATMDTLPATSFPAFALRWSGTDNTTNALTFDVFASVDEGPFVPWRVATPLNGGRFVGELGHRYAFYAVAMDAAGNRSAVPAAPMASTVTTLENRPPTFAPVATQTLFAGGTLQVQLRASDPDSSFQTLTYAVDPTSPGGVAVDPSSGLLSWVVPRALGDTTQRISVIVHDDGQPALSARLAFDVRLIGSNAEPVLLPIRNQTILAGSVVAFRAFATDADVPQQTLRFRLVGNVPDGATVDPTSGLFLWQTANARTPSACRWARPSSTPANRGRSLSAWSPGSRCPASRSRFPHSDPPSPTSPSHSSPPESPGPSFNPFPTAPPPPRSSPTPGSSSTASSTLPASRSAPNRTSPNWSGSPHARSWDWMPPAAGPSAEPPMQAASSSSAPAPSSKRPSPMS
jgi:hypothetical protein